MRKNSFLLPFFSLALSAIACSPSGGSFTGAGGAADQGGQSSLGGTPGTGGVSSSGGTTASGGTTSQGGSTLSGGSGGAGGSVATGGVNGSGGVTSSGGSTAPGSGGGAGRGTGGRRQTGGTTSAGGQGGTSNPGSGGVTNPGTGGMGTGGRSNPGTGGVTNPGTGGRSNPGTGGRTGAGGAATGGTTTTGTSIDTCTVPPSPGGGTQHCSSNASGKVGSYTWTIWSSGSGGCIIPYGVDAAFKATWNNSGDFLARIGLQWDETKTFDQYGTISADFAFTKSASGAPYSAIGIYGWSNNPLIEYYIIDDWIGSRSGAGSSRKGTFDVDGGTYDIGTAPRNNAPSIHGTTNFTQYFSVRKTARQCGHISITEHFKKWAELGMPLGKMYEAKILVEAGGGTGSIDFTSATLTAE